MCYRQKEMGKGTTGDISSFNNPKNMMTYKNPSMSMRLVVLWILEYCQNQYNWLLFYKFKKKQKKNSSVEESIVVSKPVVHRLQTKRLQKTWEYIVCIPKSTLVKPSQIGTISDREASRYTSFEPEPGAKEPVHI